MYKENSLEQKTSETSSLQTIAILTFGSRGDIQPFVALGVALHSQGYAVRVWCSEDFAEWVESYGLVAVPVYGNVMATFTEDPQALKATTNGDSLLLLKVISRYQSENAQRYVKAVLDDVAKVRPDLVIASTLNGYMAMYLALEEKIPFLISHLSVLEYNPKYMMMGLPTLPCGLHKHLFLLLTRGVISSYSTLDAVTGQTLSHQLDAKGLCGPPFVKKTRTLPALRLLSPLFTEVLAPHSFTPCWSTGTMILSSQQQMGHESMFGDESLFKKIQEFLDEKNGSRPIYLGWGSMICRSPKHMVKLCVQAVRYAQQRAIVLEGTAGLTYALLEEACRGNNDSDAALLAYARDHMLFVPRAPHEWLFPRVACIVHHGGAGTTTAAFRSGVPTVITPVFVDQYDHSYMVRELGNGVGFKKQLQKVRWKELGEAIRKVTSNDSMKRQAKVVAERLNKEDGATTAVSLIEEFWSKFCDGPSEKQKFFEYFPSDFQSPK